jgi:hypothetical protein
MFQTVPEKLKSSDQKNYLQNKNTTEGNGVQSNRIKRFWTTKEKCGRDNNYA